MILDPCHRSGFRLTPGVLSGRTMARIGLRMMPPFPSSPLSFRTADFLQSGWKAGISDGAFPSTANSARVVRFASALRAPRCPRLYLVLSRATRCAGAPPCIRFPVLPQGSSLRSRLCCPGPSTLIDPMRPTRQLTSISPTRLIRSDLAVRQLSAPRRPTSGSVLSLAILYRHVIV